MAVALAPEHPTPPGPTRIGSRGWALVVIAVAQLMIVLDASVVVVALPSAQHALHISVANRQWVMTAYTLAFGTLLLLGGRIADYLGRRRTLVVSLLGFGAASALGGMAQNALMLFAARALQGGFAAVLAPAALSLLTTTFVEPRERARAFGVYGAVAGSGAAVGLLLGGLLTQFASWRWTLLINVPIALVTAVAARRVLEESRDEVHGSYDVLGAATATAALFLLVYGFSEAGSVGWGAPLTLGLLGGSVLGLVSFLVIELRSPHPLLPLEVVRDRNRGFSLLSSLLVASALLGTFLFLSYYFQGTLGYSAFKTGLVFLPFSIGIVAGTVVSTQLMQRVGVRILMITGLLMAAAGLVWFTRLHLGAGYLSFVLAPEMLMSIGMGLTFAPMNSTALLGVDPAHTGVASALVNTTQQVGQSLGTALLNTIAATATATYIAAHPHLAGLAEIAPVHGYTTGFAVGVGFVIAATVVAAFVGGRAVVAESPAVVAAAEATPVALLDPVLALDEASAPTQ